MHGRSFNAVGWTVSLLPKIIELKEASMPSPLLWFELSLPRAMIFAGVSRYNAPTGAFPPSTTAQYPD